MKKHLICLGLSIFAMGLVSCAEEKEKEPEKTNSATVVEAIPFDNKLNGDFEEVPEKKMEELGLTPTDFEGKPVSTAALDPRVKVGMNAGTMSRIEFRNGVLAASYNRTKVTGASASEILLQNDGLAVLSNGTKMTFGSTERCAVVAGSNSNYVACETTSETNGIPSGDTSIIDGQLCMVSGETHDLMNVKKYGFLKLRNGPLIKVVWMYSERVGDAVCDNKVVGKGLQRLLLLTTPDLPDLNYPAQGVPSLVFAYFTIEQRGKLLTRALSHLDP